MSSRALSSYFRIGHCFGAQLQAQGADNLEDRAQTGVAVSRKRLVEAFTGEASVACDLRHALRTGDVAKGLGDECGIAIGFLDDVRRRRRAK